MGVLILGGCVRRGFLREWLLDRKDELYLPKGIYVRYVVSRCSECDELVRDTYINGDRAWDDWV